MPAQGLQSCLSSRPNDGLAKGFEVEKRTILQQRASMAHCDLNLEPKLVSAVAVIILGSASAFVAILGSTCCFRILIVGSV